MDNKDYFFCYNKYLSKHLQQNGIKYITKAINPTSNNTFLLFRKSKELQAAIDSYKQLSN